MVLTGIRTFTIDFFVRGMTDGRGICSNLICARIFDNLINREICSFYAD